jgi:hypothetical protein
MWIIIPYALTYTTSLRGRVAKEVNCDQCGFDYVYFFERAVAARGTSLFFLDNKGAKERSSERAESYLQNQLDQGCAVIPCPECGAVQQHMLPIARHERYKWMRAAGIAALIVAGLVALPAAIYTLIDGVSGVLSVETIMSWLGIGVLIALSAVFFIQRRNLSKAYDPNAESVVTRTERGKKFAISQKEYFRRLDEGEN